MASMSALNLGTLKAHTASGILLLKIKTRQ